MLKNTELLIGGPCPDLLCGICQDILDEPIQVHCPEDHLFCNHCIQQHTETQSSCPLCFTTLDSNSFQLSKFAQRQISRLRIQCAYHNNGCPWQGFITEKHSKECEYAPLVCPNVDRGCTDNHLSSVNIQQHIKECPYQQLSCPNGMQLCLPFLRKELEKHDNECQSYTCPYSPEGCTFIGTRNQVNIHCEGYCGRLHKSIDDLTEQIKRLNTMIQNMSIGLDIQQPSPPVQQEDLVEKDQEMNEMALFREMLNGDLFESLNLSDPKKGENTPPALPNLMDLGSLDFLDTLSNDFKFDQPAEATSPKPLKFVPPTTVPKRTTNGKKIRYSKNIQLAHSAMRAARERTAESLNDQHVIQQKNNQLALKHAVDSNKTHNDDSKSKKKKPVEPVITDPKRRPMFILASSYLSNYTATP